MASRTTVTKNIRALLKDAPDVKIYRAQTNLQVTQWVTWIQMRDTVEVSAITSALNARTILKRALPDADISVTDTIVTVRQRAGGFA